VEVTSAAVYSTLFNTYVGAAFAQGFVIRVDNTGTVTALKQDVVALGTTTKTVKRGTGVSSIAWSYNNVTGLLRIAVDGTLQSFTFAHTFLHGTVGRNRYYVHDATQAGAHKQYLFALSASDAVSDAQLTDWSINPWQIYTPRERRLWTSDVAPSGFKAAWARNSNVMIGAHR
jgi:hypothetical protein